MPEYKLGKLAATRLAGVDTLTAYATKRIPRPPASVAVPKASYPIDGNDKVGDCTIAGAAHLVAAWNAEVNEANLVPSEQEVLSTYFNLTGGADTGCNEQAVLEHWRTTGMFDSKIDAYAPVNHSRIVEIQQAIAFYGGCYFGIACPESAQQQFAEGRPWTYEPDSPVEGGHCIVGLGYSPTAVLCATWGGVAEVTYSFLAHFLDEAWCIIPDEFVEAGHGPSLDLEALKADLDQFA